jgi:hypothetical protein
LGTPVRFAALIQNPTIGDGWQGKIGWCTAVTKANFCFTDIGQVWTNTPTELHWKRFHQHASRMLRLKIDFYNLHQFTSPILNDVIMAMTRGYFIPLLFPKLRKLSADIRPNEYDFQHSHGQLEIADTGVFEDVLELCTSPAFGTPRILALRFADQPLPPNRLIMFCANPALTELVMELDWEFNLPPTLSLDFHSLRRLTLSVQQMEHFSKFFECIHAFAGLKNIQLINWSHYPSEDDIIDIFTTLTTCISGNSLTGLNFTTSQYDPMGCETSDLEGSEERYEEISDAMLEPLRYFTNLTELRLQGQIVELQ